MGLVVAVGLLCLLGGLAGGWTLRTLNAPEPAPAAGYAPAPQGTQLYTPPPAPPAPAAQAPAPPAAAPEIVTGPVERQLVQALISLYDLAEAAAVRTQIAEDLTRAGVNRIDARVGVGFDPALHRAVDTASAVAPGDVDTIARQLRPGWVTGTTIIRYAEVAVYAPPATVEPAV
ncbi:nucleotide exchange factor GrpE [Rhodococcus koreensis]|uniref:GrpE protein n=1 Tax=Rhodococcus koreensis TaxID=99653 RepID=A0A1H4IHB1_9NOCA|nr:nucleotide exchange factor GrpE [Rhodococcus koreensis]SEB33499.1 GrpE protein [Rhodococcus koreensis]